MAWQPTTRLQISGDRFLRRRLECALLGVDLRTGIDAVRAPVRSLTAGLVVAVFGLAGCLLLGVLRPQPDVGSAPIVMERQSGALYVRLGDTWHPVLNLASARLIARANADPQPVAASALAHGKRGPLLGVPGAPAFVGVPLGEGESRWTVCDRRDRTTVIVGGEPLPGALSRDQTLLVTPSSGGATYMLFDGRRAVRASGLDGQTPLPVSPVLLNLIPESPPITAPRIPDRTSTVSVDEGVAVCARWALGASGSMEVSFSVGALPIPDGQEPVSLAQADGSGPAVDAVYVAPGRAAFVRATSLSGVDAPAGTRYLVSDTGVRYAVHDDDAARDLGLPNAVIAAPWSVLAQLPAGPELSRANASVVQDVPQSADRQRQHQGDGADSGAGERNP